MVGSLLGTVRVEGAREASGGEVALAGIEPFLRAVGTYAMILDGSGPAPARSEHLSMEYRGR